MIPARHHLAVAAGEETDSPSVARDRGGSHDTSRRVHPPQASGESGGGRRGCSRRRAVGISTGGGPPTTPPEAAHADRPPGRLMPGEPLVRPLLRLRAAGAGTKARPATWLHAAGRRGRGARAVRAHRAALSRPAARLERRARPVQRRQDGRLLPQLGPAHGRRQQRDPVLHRERAAVLLQPLQELRPLCELLLLAARADLAEPVLPHVRDVGRDHDERSLGLRHLRLAQLADHPRPARRGRRELEDLLHRLRRGGGRGHRQRCGVLEPLGARPADDGDARRLSRGLPSRDAAERLLDHPELLDAVRRASGRGRERRHGLPGTDHQRAPPLPPVAQVRVLPHLRRARWLLRPRPAASDRRVRPRDSGAALGHLAVRAARSDPARESRRITSRR